MTRETTQRRLTVKHRTDTVVLSLRPQACRVEGLHVDPVVVIGGQPYHHAFLTRIAVNVDGADKARVRLVPVVNLK